MDLPSASSQARAATDGASGPGSLLGRLRAAQHDLGLLTGPADRERYRQDATRRPGPLPDLVLRPAGTEAVAEALAICHAAGRPVCIQGGLTGLSGGARPQAGEVVLTLERMRRVGAVDPASATVLADAGAALETVQNVAREAGMMVGVDIGARGSATIGGMIATNAGGIRVLRYGMMRAQVAGLEAVLADGRILSALGGLAKDNAGPDLSQPMIGSEGIFGVITRARLRLLPVPPVERVALIALPDLPSAMVLLRNLRDRMGPRLSAFEGIWPEVYAGVNSLRGTTPLPVGAGMYVIAELHGFEPEADTLAFETILMEMIEAGICEDVVLSQSTRDFGNIWTLREDCNEYCFGLGRLAGHDISLPGTRIGDFVAAATAHVARADPAARVLIYGHLGDGNLHFLVQTEDRSLVSPGIYELAAGMGGSISAEHGIGADKRSALPLVRSAAQISALRALKSALDPAGILSPGRILP